MGEDLRSRVVNVLKTVYDPEIPVNIYELGLVYDVAVTPEGDASVRMTLTAPNCPVAGILPNQVKERILNLEGVRSADVQVVFDPPWDRSKMSDVAKLALGFDLDLGRDTVPLSKLAR
jgi:FeS assembly SUF system protein